MQIMSPPLALGQVVHEVVESLSKLETDKRFSEPLIDKFNRAWDRLSGKRGGFFDTSVEGSYKRRGEEMIRRITNKPGPVSRLAVKIQMDLPHYWLSEEDNIILCGKIDWLEFLPETKSVHIIDFKTGKSRENNSLQLPIYHLLVHNCQRYPVKKNSYWYLEQNDAPVEQLLPSLKKSYEDVFKIAKKIKLARQLESFTCPHGDTCPACQPFEEILDGKGELVGTGEYGYDIYVLPHDNLSEEDHQEVLL